MYTHAGLSFTAAFGLGLVVLVGNNILVTAAIFLVIYLNWYHVFDSVTFAPSMEGGFTLVYKEHIGMYSSVGPVFNEVTAILRKNGFVHYTKHSAGVYVCVCWSR